MEQDSNWFGRDLWEDIVMTSSETAGSDVQTMSNIHSFLQGLIDGEWFLPSQPGLSVSFQPVLSVQGHSTSDRPVSQRGLGQGQCSSSEGPKDAPTHQKERTSTSHKHYYASTWSSSLLWYDTFPMEFFSSVTFNNLKLEYLLIFLCGPQNHTIISRLYLWKIQNNGLFSKLTTVFYGLFFVHCSLYASWYKPGDSMLI